MSLIRSPRDLARAAAAGFTLVELSVVFTIVALLLGSLMYTLSAQVEQRNFEDTRRRIELARELLLAFAVVKGRLPCPARSAATMAPVTTPGDEVWDAATGRCLGDGIDDNYGGVFPGPPLVTLGLLPARTIGVTQVDAAGFAVDAWGNRLRYVVARSNTNCAVAPPANTRLFTHMTNLKTWGVSCQPDDLLVCRSSTAITATACGGAANQIMSQSLVVAIVFSTGKNGATSGGTGADEAANLNGDPVFVFHTPTPLGAANGEFDDQFTWITVGELYGRLIAAGQLP